MSNEIVIVLGLGIICALMSFFAFEFLTMENPDPKNNWYSRLGLLCLFLALIFLNMIMYTIILVAQNSGLQYLNDTILVWGLTAVMYSTISVLALYLFFLTFSALVMFYQVIHDRLSGKRHRTKGDVQ